MGQTPSQLSYLDADMRVLIPRSVFFNVGVLIRDQTGQLKMLLLPQSFSIPEVIWKRGSIPTIILYITHVWPWCFFCWRVLILNWHHMNHIYTLSPFLIPYVVFIVFKEKRVVVVPPAAKPMQARDAGDRRCVCLNMVERYEKVKELSYREKRLEA